MSVLHKVNPRVLLLVQLHKKLLLNRPLRSLRYPRPLSLAPDLKRWLRKKRNVHPPRRGEGGRPRSSSAEAEMVDTKTVLANAGVGAKKKRTKGVVSSALRGESADGYSPSVESPPAEGTSSSALALPSSLDPSLPSLPSLPSVTSRDSSVSEDQNKVNSESAGSVLHSSPSGSESSVAEAQVELGDGKMEVPYDATSAGVQPC